jgi:hypothetical protein
MAVKMEAAGHLKHWYPIATPHGITTQKKSTCTYYFDIHIQEMCVHLFLVLLDVYVNIIHMNVTHHEMSPNTHA